MLGWLRRFESLQTTVREFDDVAATIEELKSRVADVRDELTTALTSEDFFFSN